jgi:signal transduction histidine kinase
MQKSHKSLAEVIQRAHHMLLADLSRLEELGCTSARGSVAELNTQLRTVQTHLLRHFRLEEQDGYMDAVLKRDPGQERAVQQVLSEHQQLSESLSALIKDLSDRLRIEEALRLQLGEWIESVRQHESRENLLIENVFNQDIGAED